MATTHLRAEWQSVGEPVTGPKMPWSQIDTVAIHYTAAVDLIDGDPGENWAGIPAYLRSIQHDYLTHRPQADGSTGYSVGYNWAVDARGDMWELRGWDIKCAANKGHNDHVVAILMLVDGDDPATPAAAESVRQLVFNAEQWAKRKLPVTAHGWLAPGTEARPITSCCGHGLKAQIKAGEFIPRPPPPPPPPVDESPTDELPTPEPESEPMPLLITCKDPSVPGQYLIVQGTVVPVATPEMAVDIMRDLTPRVVTFGTPTSFWGFLAAFTTTR